MPSPGASRHSETRRDSGGRAFPLRTHSVSHSNMDSDEEMQQIDTELPSFPSVAKGKGKAVLHDELEDPAGARDNTLPWYMKSLSRSR